MGGDSSICEKEGWVCMGMVVVGEKSECFRDHQRVESKGTKRKKLLSEVRD